MEQQLASSTRQQQRAQSSARTPSDPYSSRVAGSTSIRSPTPVTARNTYTDVTGFGTPYRSSLAPNFSLYSSVSNPRSPALDYSPPENIDRYPFNVRAAATVANRDISGVNVNSLVPARRPLLITSTLSTAMLPPRMNDLSSPVPSRQLPTARSQVDSHPIYRPPPPTASSTYGSFSSLTSTYHVPSVSIYHSRAASPAAPAPSVSIERARSVARQPRVSEAPASPPQYTPVGIPNVGNSCYLNSVLQCLLAHRTFMQALSRAIQASRRGTPMSAALVELAAVASDRATSSYSSRSKIEACVYSIKDLLAKRNSEFAGYEQADAHEVLRTLLDISHDELNRGNSRVAYEELKDIPGEDPYRTAQRWHKYHKLRDDSLIYDFFGGVCAAETECSTCRGRSYAFDPFLDASIPLPKLSTISSRTHPPQMIENLIQNTLEPDIIDENQKWKCSLCKQLSAATRRQITFIKPKTSVWHFKRFNSRGEKNELRVLFSVRMMSSVHDPTLEVLYAVVCHVGSASGGHYTSYVKASDKWYLCNDSIITEVNAAEVINNPNTYLLFYELIPSNPVPSRRDLL